MTDAEIVARIESAVLEERLRIAKLLRLLEVTWRCPECDSHNEHSQCVVPGPRDYAAAVLVKYEVRDGQWVSL